MPDFKNSEIKTNAAISSMILLHIWIGDMDSFIPLLEEHNKRVNKIEEAFLSILTLWYGGQEIEHSKVFEIIWDKWGIPDADLFRKLTLLDLCPDNETSLGRGH